VNSRVVVMSFATVRVTRASARGPAVRRGTQVPQLAATATNVTGSVLSTSAPGFSRNGGRDRDSPTPRSMRRIEGRIAYAKASGAVLPDWRGPVMATAGTLGRERTRSGGERVADPRFQGCCAAAADSKLNFGLAPPRVVELRSTQGALAAFATVSGGRS
jgi:hypothetical protein